MSEFSRIRQYSPKLPEKADENLHEDAEVEYRTSLESVCCSSTESGRLRNPHYGKRGPQELEPVFSSNAMATPEAWQVPSPEAFSYADGRDSNSIPREIS